MEATGGTLLVLGAVSMVAAIVGGNVSLPGGTTFGALSTSGVRAALAVFSLLLLVGGGVLLSSSGSSATPPGPGPSPTTSDSARAPEPSPEPGPAGPSRAEYVAAAESICLDDQRRKRSAPTPDPSLVPQEQVALLLENQREIVVETNARLRALAAPSGDEEEVQAFLQGHDRLVQAFYDLEAAWAQQDETAGEALNRELDVVVSELNAAARGYGLDSCVVTPSSSS